MRKILFLFLSFFVLQNVSGQCPGNAQIGTAENGRCIRLQWNDDPSPHPTTFVYNGITYNNTSPSGTEVIYRRGTETGGCGTFNNLTGTITFTIL